MSRFSRKEAEARGWVFVHDKDEETITTSETHGETRTIPRSIRAEKTINGINAQAEGETEGLVLERIAFIENTQESLPATGPAALDITQLPRDDAGFPLRTVRTAEGDFTDAEYTERARRNDIVVTEDGQQVHSGASIDAAPLTSLDAALEARDRESQRIENMRAAEAPIDTVHITTDTSGAVDSPGIGAGASLVVPADSVEVGEPNEETGLSEVEHPMDSVRESIDAEAQAAENERVRDTEFGLGRTPAPEGREELAGVDVGIATRSDLASDAIPPIGHTVEAVEGLREQADSARRGEVSTTEGPTAERAAEVEQARIDAVQDKVADQGAGAQDTGSATAQAEASREAAAETEQESIEQAEEESDEQTGDGDADTSAPKATEAARKHAEEKGVDLSEVKGSGADGKITAPDVDKHADAKNESA